MKRKKVIMVAITAAIGLCLILGLSFYIKNILNGPPPDDRPIPEDLGSIVMEYEYIVKAEYKDNPLYVEMRLEPGSPFTWVEIVNNNDSLQYQEQYFQFTGPANFDFENYTLFISYGREILELECKFSSFHENQYVFSATFENEHQGNIAFFYRIEKRQYWPMWMYGLCYIMDGEEKVFIGNDVSYFNTYKNEAP